MVILFNVHGFVKTYSLLQFELLTKAWTRQGKHVRNEVKVFLDSNTFP
jgi:hypothetical protein